MSVALPLLPATVRPSFRPTLSKSVKRRTIAMTTTATMIPIPSVLSSSSSLYFRIPPPNSLFAKSTTTPPFILISTSRTTTNPLTISPTQRRHATLLRRPKRPYTFTQLVTLSDGSTFIHRTTSPTPVYRSTRDTRNTLLWNPSSQKLLTVEDDEAGRLAAFRARFGRAWDATSSSTVTAGNAGTAGGQLPMATKGENTETSSSAGANAENAQQHSELEAVVEEEDDLLLDLISSYGQEEMESLSPKTDNKKK